MEIFHIQSCVQRPEILFSKKDLSNCSISTSNYSRPFHHCDIMISANT